MSEPKKEKWIDVNKRLPRSNRDVLVLCSDGTITRGSCVHWRNKVFAGWVFDLFAQPAPNSRPLMWRRIEKETQSPA